MTASRRRPLVSIVLPTFNGERYLRESIESCLAQAYEPIELILVDDCSTDRTPEIIGAVCAAHPNVRAIRHETNRRLPSALNTGFRAAQGDYLTWTSDDNRYEPDAIERMVDLLESRPDVGMVCCDMVMMGPDGAARGLLAARPDLLLRENRVGACFLYRREVAASVGEYRAEFALVEDYDYWLRVAKRFAIVRLPLPLYRYRLHPGSLSARRTTRVREQAARLLYTHARGVPEGRASAADLYYDFYWRRRAAGDVRGAFAAAWWALRLVPTRGAHWKAVLRCFWLLALSRPRGAQGG
jgi:glycosyltransferase involved in cell wall biosynthesis